MEGGAKRVIVTGPSREVPMYVRGVNFDKYKSEETIVSCGLSLSLFGWATGTLDLQRFRNDLLHDSPLQVVAPEIQNRGGHDSRCACRYFAAAYGRRFAFARRLEDRKERP